MMPNELDPLLGQWYLPADNSQRFQVIAVDSEADTVDIQLFDGDIEELSFDDWAELDIALCEEPENWSGALDIGEQDDFGTEVTDTSAEDWAESGEGFRPAEQEGAPDRIFRTGNPKREGSE
ncbi:DUF6763 family protein [Kineobactrum sediminis]|nr:DUF6763 family protein [Kineobactrum sediminis]